jgi:hypothetical protein
LTLKLYEKRVKKDWPGVQPDALPALIGFRARKPMVPQAQIAL